METLVVVGHPRNHHQYHGRSRGHGLKRFGSYGSPPPGCCFRGISCRTFHAGEGLIAISFKSCSNTTPVTKQAFCSSTLKTPSTSPNENLKSSNRIAKCKSVPIPIDFKFENDEGGFHFSELWAGPAYSNSPPPSCLPIPKFSLKPKRTVSLELPTVPSDIDLHPVSKSAPASPTRERSTFLDDLFDIADSATKTLRRILNLDITDDEWRSDGSQWLL